MTLTCRTLVWMLIASACGVAAVADAAPVSGGQFGPALDAHTGGAAAVEADNAFALPPLTVEAWVRLDDADGYNVIVSSEDKQSATHWELYTENGSGHLAAYLPGYEPAIIEADVAVTDQQWRHVGLTFAADRVRLYVDGERVADEAIEPVRDLEAERIRGPLMVGYAIDGDGRVSCRGLIEQVRIRAGIHPPRRRDDAMGVADQTLGLWQFDRISSDGHVRNLGSRGTRLRLDAAPEPPPDYADEPFREHIYDDNRWDEMDTGPFFSGSIRSPHSVTTKGIAIRLGDEGQAAMMFDTELLRMSKAWTGDLIRTHPLRFGLLALPEIGGELAWVTREGPGWDDGEGGFDDPRRPRYGPLPESWGRYNGLHLHGDRVVLDYSVGDFDVLESPWVVERGGLTVFTRTMEIGPGRAARMEVAHRADSGPLPHTGALGGPTISLLGQRDADPVTAAALVGDGPALFSTVGDRVFLTLEARDQPVRLKLLIWTGPRDQFENFRDLVIEADADADGPEPLDDLLEPGPQRWGEPLVTEGVVSRRDDAYVIDTLTVPYDNPWNALMFIGGHDFLPNGDAVVATAHGDVWIVSGIDDSLERLEWKRFATGLFQPLGVRVVDGEIYVAGRDQITILRDRNGDGEADHYENFNNHGRVTHNGHEYVTNLEIDSEGYFYYTKADSGGASGHDGSILRVSPDGSELDVYATGLRNTNGLGMGPGDVLTVAPNEGTWTPASMIAIVEEGGFYGYMPSHHRDEAPEDFDPPLCFIPRELDNSSGSQVWAPEGWGPLGGQMLHLSFGRASWMLVLPQQVDETLWQGGVVELPGRFLSGAHRGRFHPQDSQLYVSGIQGWQTAAVRDGSLQRVRYTGGDVYLPQELNVGGTCIRLTFTQPLRRDFAENIESYAIEQWQYRWSAAYGSDDWSVASPDRRGRDPVAIASASLSEDGRSVCLEVPSLQTVMQMGIRYNLEAADGSLVRGAVYNTINAVPETCPCESE